ncbi:type II toxin-antitoxin system VapC family toxin [Arcanobacterium ihumii]|uniref:type II toxin-antitoxin system VapC family toxin n=1 Tax=Arcanobacterium ihumii TaxID=2138162 RepID=UPI000F538353|nr:type II toxin-antitoxin system VapC family toxin [Arcanobacterium ihumii]
MPHLVFVDANILASRTLMDWLFHLRNKTPGMFTLQTSKDVITEVCYTIRRKYPQASDSIINKRVQRIQELMDEVLTEEFDGNLSSFTGSDINDYHVHAAAIKATSQYILTNNKSTDITTTPDDQPYSIIAADDFLCLVAQSAPHACEEAINEQFLYWAKDQKLTDPKLEEHLVKAGCPKFANIVHNSLFIIKY